MPARLPLFPSPVVLRPRHGRVMQRVDHPDPAAANDEALHDLAGGTTGLALVFEGAVGAYGFGLAASEQTIGRALDGVHLDAGITLDLDLGPRAWDAARLLARLLDRRGTAPAATNIRLGFDPIGAATLGGGSPSPWSSLGPRFSLAISELRDRGFRGPFAAADGRIIHNAGGSEAQELAYVLAVAIAYLRALEAGATTLHAARDMIYFRLAADTDQLLTVAKLRALRKLWARIEEACGLTPAAACIAADTAWRMMAKRDPYVNMVRSTIAVAAAGIGGADAVTVLPFTIALGLPDRFARRIARNTQLVLLEEANLARVADPAAGAGGIEDLTSRLCRAAWTQFQEIEQAGGAWRALEQGLIQRKVAAVRAQREAALARRKDSLTGTSNFPDLEETAVTVLDVPRTSVERHPTAVTFDALPRIRLAEPFERLRDASDLTLARSGARPRVFLADLGAISDFTARATFARNSFRGRRHRGDRQRRVRGERRDGRGLQEVGRRPRLPVWVRCVLCEGSDHRGRSPDRGRLQAPLSRRPSRRRGTNAARCRCRKLRLRRLRRVGDTRRRT